MKNIILNKYAKKVTAYTGNIMILASIILFTACSQSIEQPITPKNKEKTPFNWSTCEVLFKEGHTHGMKFHGNPTFEGSTMPKEQYFVLKRNTNGDIYMIPGKGMDSRKYLIAIAGWKYAMRLVFKDANGKVINDKIISNGMNKHYQIFYTVSDKDSGKKKYTPIDVRTGKNLQLGNSSNDISKLTNKFYDYIYRDTNPDSVQIDDPIPGKKDTYSTLLYKTLTDNIRDYIGLKGYFTFKLFSLSDNSDEDDSGLLAQYFIAMRMFYINTDKYLANSMEDPKAKCPLDYDSPFNAWKEIFRFNLPIKIIADLSDSYPRPERYYKDLSREFGKTPDQLKEEDDKATPEDNSTFYM